MVLSVAFSTDGSQIAFAPLDGTGRIWDIAAGKVVVTLLGHESPVTFIAFSSSDKAVVTASKDGTVRTWNSADGTVKSCRTGPDGEISRAVLSPSTQTLATVTGTTIGVWDLRSDVPPKLMREDGDGQVSAAFLPDEVRLLSCSNQGIQLWDYQTGTSLKSITLDMQVLRLAVSSNGDQMALGCNDGRIHLWDTRSWSTLGVLEGHSHGIQSMAFSPDSSTLASASLDCSIRVWNCKDNSTTLGLSSDVPAGRSRFTFATPTDGGCLVSISEGEQELKVWDLKGPSSPKTFIVEGTVHAIVCSPDGRVFYTVQEHTLEDDSAQGFLHLWDSSSLRCVAKWEIDGLTRGHGDWGVTSFSRDGSLLATSFQVPINSPTQVRVWSIESGPLEVKVTESSSTTIRIVTFSSDNKRVFYATGDEWGVWALGSVAPLVHEKIIWSLDERVLMSRFLPGDRRIALALSEFAGLTYKILDSTTLSTLTYWEYGSRFPIVAGFNDDFPRFLEVRGDMLWEYDHLSERRLCWLPPGWRSDAAKKRMVLCGSFLVFPLQESHIGVLDIAPVRQASRWLARPLGQAINTYLPVLVKGISADITFYP